MAPPLPLGVVSEDLVNGVHGGELGLGPRVHHRGHLRRAGHHSEDVRDVLSSV